jgi:V8-like Glu-specific endopeptidase
VVVVAAIGVFAQIVGGAPDSTSGVVLTNHGGGQCTGTVIGERVVLTAAHCVESDILADNHVANIDFGDGGDAGFTDRIAAQRLAMHRYFDIADIRNYDIGLIRLRDPVPAGTTIHPFNLDPLPDLVGRQVRTVGFGVTDGDTQTGAGEKRSAFVTVTGQTAVHVEFGGGFANICQGDSGGPTFADLGDGVETAIAVSSYTTQACAGESGVVRTDAYRDWVIEVYDAWNGPCQHDFACVTDGCRTPDPDCDSCGFDGFCQSGCPAIDLDCPVGGFAGDLCGNDDGCETRLCVDALDDPRISYCSVPCEAGECAAPLALCVGGVCHYDGPSPGAQGFPCEQGSECRSGVCDPADAICIEQCGDGFADCPDGFECRSVGSNVEACRLPEEGGCLCRAGAGGGPGLPGLALLWFLWRRRS